VLLPAEVLPFLSHEDPSLRDFARHYLGDAHDPWPVTADDLWAAMDRVAPGERAYLAKYLWYFPLTPRSTERLFEGLGGAVDDHDLWHHLVNRLQDHPPEDIRRALADPVIGQRLARSGRASELSELLGVLELTFDRVWEAAEAFTARIAGKEFCIGPDWEQMTRLRRGLLRHGRQAAARGVEVLRRPAPRDGRAAWTQALVVVLFERMREPEALEPLFDIATAPHNHFALAGEWAADALGHLGTPEVIAEATARYQDGTLCQWWAPRMLGRIKRPESERALIGLFLAERRIEESTRLAVALCELCSAAPEVIESLRDMVEHELFDPIQGALDERLLVVYGMHGWEPAPHWQRRIAARKAAEEAPNGRWATLATARRAGKG
jgi:hypothetical protein